MHRSTTTVPATPPSCLSLIATHVSPPRQRCAVHRLCCTVTHTRYNGAYTQRTNRAVLRRALGTLRLSRSRIRRARATSPPRGQASGGKPKIPEEQRGSYVYRGRAVRGGRANAPFVNVSLRLRERVAPSVGAHSLVARSSPPVNLYRHSLPIFLSRFDQEVLSCVNILLMFGIRI